MAMSIRCLVGKVARVTCNRNITRSEASLYMASGGSTYSSRHPFDSGDHTNQGLDLHHRLPKRDNLDFHGRNLLRCPIHDMCPSTPDILLPARFAVEEFNNQKDAQLQFVRVVRVSKQENYPPIFFITIEAVDAADHPGVVKVYQAMVAWRVCNILDLILFGRVVHDGTLLKLIDNRPARKFDSRGQSMKKKKVLRKTRGYPVEDEMLSTLRMFPHSFMKYSV